MAIKVAINGFGRIGRLVARAMLEQKGSFDIVSINDLTDAKTLAHLFKYDSVHRKFNGTVDVKTYDAADADGVIGELVINGDSIKITAERNPADLPHDKFGVDYVVEATGLFANCTDPNKPSAKSHLKDGVKGVVVTQPGKGVDATVCVGVNEEVLTSDMTVVSNASCTTNCLAPLAKVLHDKYGIVRGLMTTIHSYTNDQRILDLPHSDLRRARAAGLSQIPTKTGAAAAIGLVIPDLVGKLDGFAIRVPTPNVSCVDLVAELKEDAGSAEEINALFKEAAASSAVLNYSDENLVSSDFIGDPASSTFDAGSTRVIEGNFVKVLSWYDNEWGYSCRVVDLVKVWSAK
jgi:glyceraldehyde 3-phosphate dehydrogenase